MDRLEAINTVGEIIDRYGIRGDSRMTLNGDTLSVPVKARNGITTTFDLFVGESTSAERLADVLALRLGMFDVDREFLKLFDCRVHTPTRLLHMLEDARTQFTAASNDIRERANG